MKIVDGENLDTGDQGDPLFSFGQWLKHLGKSCLTMIKQRQRLFSRFRPPWRCNTLRPVFLVYIGVYKLLTA